MFTKRKRNGPSKLALKRTGSQSQSQCSPDLSQLSTSQPTIFEEDDNKTPLSQSLPATSSKSVEDHPPAGPSPRTLSQSFLQDEAIIVLSSDPEDVFKPSKPKKLKTAPALDKLKASVDIKYEPPLEAEAIKEEPEVAPVTQLRSNRLAAKLKSFEREPPKKFPVVRQSSKECLDNVVSIKNESSAADGAKQLSPVKVTKEAPTEEPKELPCPICNKPAGKNRRAHLKNCAGKNGLTTAQLLQAVELQKKQAEERKELGLPFFLQNQNKPLAKKKNTVPNESDPNVQLALALSKSLKDAEDEAFMRETRLLLENQETFEGMTESQVDATIKAVIKEPSPAKKPQQTILALGGSGSLQIVKSAPLPATKSSRSGKIAPFMTADPEERMRRVTEKVAMYLIDDEREVVPPKAADLRPVVGLLDAPEKDSDLWRLASVSPSKEKQSFYVNELRDFVSPSKSNRGLMLLEPAEPKIRQPSARTKRKSLGTKAEPNESPRKDKTSSLSRDWALLLNSRTMSDVVVYAKEERELRAHKLVLFVRCPAIVKELASEVGGDGSNPSEHMLLWSEFSYDVVLAALEFIYCDTTCQAMKLTDEDLNDLETISQRYEINELEEHINMLKRLRETVTAEEFPIEPSADSPLEPQVVEETDEESEEENGDFRTELSYLVSQMEKPTQFGAKKRETSPELAAEIADVVDENIENPEGAKEASQEDLFASMEETQFFNELMNPDSGEVSRNSEQDKTLSEDWRNLDGLDYLSPAKSTRNSPITPVASFSKSPAKTRSPNFAEVSPLQSPAQEDNEPRSQTPPIEVSPFSSPEFRNKDSTPLEIVTLSSDSTSQKSVASLSPKVASPSTPMRLPLDDSLDVFEDGDITRLEMAALKAYEKVMTPKPGPSKAMSTPASAKMTPLADYSIMDSPQLQRELGKFGIKKLRRNQAKLILRHIYNELHPVVSSTPVARPPEKRKPAQEKKTKQPAKRQTQAVKKPTPTKATQKKVSPKKPSPAKAKTATKSSVHNLSSSQPEGYDSFDELLFDKPKKPVSASQPVHCQDSESSDDDSSDNEGYGKYVEGEILDEVGTQTVEPNLSEKIEETLKSDPGLYHRILTYEPIWLEEIKDLLKQNKVKCNANALLDYLDDQCITYRHDHQRPARQTQKRGWTQSQRGRKKKDFDL